MHETMSHMVLAMVQMEKSFSGKLLDKTSVLKSKLDNLVGIIEDENSSKFKELVDQARKQSDKNEAITKTEEITVTEI